MTGIPSLVGKTAIVTGASSGIGAGIAVGLAAAGADLAVVGRDRSRLAATVAAVEGAGRRALALETDLTRDGAAESVVAAALDRHGRVDVLVNSAGTFELAPFDAAESLAQLDRQWETNVRAPFALTRAAISSLRQARGSVLFISSIGGRVGFPTGSGYCATKGAIENLVRVLALEEAPYDVTVNAIAPGNVRTAMNDHLLARPEYEQAMLAATPAKRIGVVDDVVPAAVFLVSDCARYITGACLVIDGGWTAQ